jgi:hypothetical protein
MAIVVAALAMAATGCGGSGSSADKSSNSTATPAPEGPKGEPSAEFLGKGPNGKLAKVGREASAAEREAASRVLEKSFNARAAGEWAEQCKTLASSLVLQIEKSLQVLAGVVTCSKALKVQAGSVPPSVRANNMTGPVVALRVNQGINGFAFYHGTDGKNYVIPLIKQHGWKLVSPAAQEVG